MERYRHIIKENAAVLKMGVWLVGLKMNESHVAGARWEERWDRERGARGHIVYCFTDYCQGLTDFPSSWQPLRRRVT